MKKTHSGESLFAEEQGKTSLVQKKENTAPQTLGRGFWGDTNSKFHLLKFKNQWLLKKYILFPYARWSLGDILK